MGTCARRVGSGCGRGERGARVTITCVAETCTPLHVMSRLDHHVFSRERGSGGAAGAGRRGYPRVRPPRFAEMCSGSEEGSYLRLIDLCITQL